MPQSPLGPLMIDVDGYTLTAEDREVLAHPLVGGLIFFGRNFESRAQIAALVKEVRAVNPNMLLAVDHEGGRVQRFRDGFNHPAAVRKLGEIYDQDPARGTSLSEEYGYLVAAEVKALDIDLSFAPVLDLDFGVSTVIGDRALHSEPAAVIALATAMMAGMHRAGVAATGKHYPGHGGIAADSHLELPIDERPFDELWQHDLLPFRELSKLGMPSVMIAHVVYPDVCPQPAGFSSIWVQDILRLKIGFEGVIFSDDLSMAGAEFAGGFLERAEATLAVGCDMALVCNNREAAVEVIDGLRFKPSAEQSARLQSLRNPNGLDFAMLEQQSRWSAAIAALKPEFLS